MRAWFTPGRGTSLAHRIAHSIDRARQRVRICSPVVSSGPILGTLAQVATDDRVDVAGVVDATQITQVITNGTRTERRLEDPAAPAIEEGGFTGKRSTPWAPGTVHDFMHAKVTVADDTVFVGSFNLSRSGELNAENVLEIANAELADRLAAYVDDVRNRYGAMVLPEPLRLVPTPGAVTSSPARSRPRPTGDTAAFSCSAYAAPTPSNSVSSATSASSVA